MRYIGGADMDYMTLREAGEKWGISPRQINYYCSEGRIPGAEKMGTVWLIPKDAEKPIDGRTKQGKEQKNAKNTLC
jgi:predicted site-specific integrase-resolvase